MEGKQPQSRCIGQHGTEKIGGESLNIPEQDRIFPAREEHDMSGMKSAYELAMERLGGESDELTTEQKEAIAEIDSRMKAKVAETEIMFDQQLATEADPAKAALIQQTRQQQIAKIKGDAEAEKEHVRSNA